MPRADPTWKHSGSMQQPPCNLCYFIIHNLFLSPTKCDPLCVRLCTQSSVSWEMTRRSSLHLHGVHCLTFFRTTIFGSTSFTSGRLSLHLNLRMFPPLLFSPTCCIYRPRATFPTLFLFKKKTALRCQDLLS